MSTVVIIIQWCIPDVPTNLRDQIKREAYLTNELIIEYETQEANKHPCKFVYNYLFYFCIKTYTSKIVYHP